jgi:hypothetical protein
MAQQPIVGEGLLIIEASQSHSDTPQSVGLLWMSDQPVAETSTWQHTTLTRDRHLCPGRVSNPQSQQANGHRPVPWTMQPLGSTHTVSYTKYPNGTKETILLYSVILILIPKLGQPLHITAHAYVKLVTCLNTQIYMLHLLPLVP